jgi:threonine/homoserine/homoserine lactone efflux protein
VWIEALQLQGTGLGAELWRLPATPAQSTDRLWAEMSIGSLPGHLLAFAGAALLLAIVPGPSMAVVVRQTLRHGRRAAFAATVANELGLLFWALVASLGLSALVAASQAAYLVFRVVGAAVLVVLGVQSLLEARRHANHGAIGDADLNGSGEAGDLDGGAADYSAWRSFRVGTVTILANPKAAVFAASFLPQFVPAHAPMLPTLLVLSVIWVVVDTAWWVALAWAVQRAKRVLARPSARRRLEQASGALLIGLGIRLAVEHR